jgi:hypothetical protein
MTSEDIDIERLADYAAGALPRREAAKVARLAEADPTVAQMLAELTEGQQRAQASLRSLPSEPIPDDVATYVSAAWRAEAGRTTARRGRPAARRWWRPATALAGVAAALTAVAVAVSVLHAGSGTNARSAATNPQSGSGNALNSQLPAGPPGVLTLSSGTNYTQATLGAIAATRIAAADKNAFASGAKALQPLGGSPFAAESVPASLDRLRGPNALAACLQALAAVQPGTVTSVDFARYEGIPALIVVIGAAAAHTHWVAVVGPDCGLSGADLKYVTTVP